MIDFNRYKLVFTFFCSITLLSSSVFAEETLYTPSRHALVIGNDAYKFAPLRNPKHDAELIKRTLLKLDFNVVSKNNLTRNQFYSAVRDFTEQLPLGSIAFVYYAGHGIQLKEQNYLIPVNMQLIGERSVALRAFPLISLLERMNTAKSAVNIVILDACRNNPFKSQSDNKYRNFSQMGLVKTVSPKGTLIAYSTSPGQLAADGRGRSNSLYTETLAQQMLLPDLIIENIFKNVANVIRKKTLDDQQPWYESSLVDSFYLTPPVHIKTLTKAPINRIKSTTAYSASRQIPSWYLSLKGEQWNELEWQLNNRSKHLTQDEIPLLEYRADSNNLIAMTTLGLAYRDGFKQGINENGEVHSAGANNGKSFLWLLKAAESGFPIAQRELGELYIHGTGVDFDSDTGLHWLERAAQFDYPKARLNFAQRQHETNPTKESMNSLWQTMKSNTALIQQQKSKTLRTLFSH